MTDRIGEATTENREYAPRQAERADEIADVSRTQAQVHRHRRAKRRDDPAIETHQAEADTQQGHHFPLVVCVPLPVGNGHMILLCALVVAP